MQSLRKGEWSAITRVKVLSPEICQVALGQGFLHPEASIAAHDIGECVSGVPGSKSIAGHLTVHDGTWESYAVLERSLQQAEEARRRYDSMAVGPGHIRGTDEVMPIQSREPGTLEKPGSKTQRDEQRMPYTEMENITLAKLPSYLNGFERIPSFSLRVQLSD
ncbi:MAG: hypothetical protein OEW48_12950 [Phycisphaerae bacterium]|nr:hypothetical protein [Phycisphaerae bacterium]